MGRRRRGVWQREQPFAAAAIGAAVGGVALLLPDPSPTQRRLILRDPARRGLRRAPAHARRYRALPGEGRRGDGAAGDLGARTGSAPARRQGRRALRARRRRGGSRRRRRRRERVGGGGGDFFFSVPGGVPGGEEDSTGEGAAGAASVAFAGLLAAAASFSAALFLSGRRRHFLKDEGWRPLCFFGSQASSRQSKDFEDRCA